MGNLSASYLDIRFENPFVLASAPPTANAEMISRAFDAGWSGAVVKTLTTDPTSNVKNRFETNKIGNEIVGFKNVEMCSEMPPDKWYKEIEILKKRFPEKIVIGSVMGDAKNEKQWLDLTLGCQEAGADIIELNFSCPHGYPEKGRGAAIGQSADYSSTITKWVKNDKRITIPIVPKLTATALDISEVGSAVAKVGADGLCAINTYPSLMGFDLKTLKPKVSIGGYTAPGGYSGVGLKPIALRCVSDLAKNPGLPIMACGGISSGFDTVEFILLGAPIVQVCTEVMLKGYGIVSKMKRELEEFMGWHGFEKIDDFIGKGLESICQYSELNTSFNSAAKIDPEKCTGCKKCFIACRDGGYQAIEMAEKKALINTAKCRGCSLCYHLCPEAAIEMLEL